MDAQISRIKSMKDFSKSWEIVGSCGRQQVVVGVTK